MTRALHLLALAALVACGGGQVGADDAGRELAAPGVAEGAPDSGPDVHTPANDSGDELPPCRHDGAVCNVCHDRERFWRCEGDGGFALVWCADHEADVCSRAVCVGCAW